MLLLATFVKSKIVSVVPQNFHRFTRLLDKQEQKAEAKPRNELFFTI